MLKNRQERFRNLSSEDKKNGKSNQKLDLYFREYLKSNLNEKEFRDTASPINLLIFKFAHLNSAVAKSHDTSIFFALKSEIELQTKLNIIKMSKILPTSTRYIFSSGDELDFDKSGFEVELQSFYSVSKKKLPYAAVVSSIEDLINFQKSKTIDLRLLRFLVITNDELSVYKGHGSKPVVIEVPLWPVRFYLLQLNSIRNRVKLMRSLDGIGLPSNESGTTILEVTEPKRNLRLNFSAEAKRNSSVILQTTELRKIPPRVSALKRYENVYLDHNLRILSSFEYQPSKFVRRIQSGILLPTVNPHHSHFFLESLSKLFLLDTQSINANFVVSPEVTLSQLDYLKTVFDADHEILKIDQKSIFFFTELFALSGDFYMSEEGREFLIKSFDKILSTRPNVQENEKCRVYFSRRDARGYRNLINESECINVFKKFQFKIVDASSLTAFQKFALCRNAEIIAGPLGAAFHYAAMMRRPKTFTITSKLYLPLEFDYLWRTPVDYRILLSTPVLEFDEHQGAHSSHIVNLDLLRSELEDFL